MQKYDSISRLFSHRALPNTLHRVFTPIRIYYRVMRWIFGKNYDPFETNIKEGLHPLPAFLKAHDFPIRATYYAPICILPLLLIILVHKFFNKK
jgi:hypothetical protein